MVQYYKRDLGLGLVGEDTASQYTWPEATTLQPSTTSSANDEPVKVSVAIFVGEPLDYQQYRHTSLCLRYRDTKPTIIHIIGPNMGYELQLKNGCEPTEIADLAKEVGLGSVIRSTTKAQLSSIICQTPIDNSSREFNCQLWVGDALKRLAQAGHLTHEQCEDGINRMVDVIMEAKDEAEV